jgi:4-hydroxy-2-oxoheptanedioate aldolase
MNHMLARLGEGATVLGAWMFLREPLVAKAAADLDYDYVCIDMQHGLHDFGEVATMLAATAGSPATPVVRTPWNEPGLVGRLLDAGALGIIFPMVNTRADAERAVSACRYAPDGARSLGPIGAIVRYGPGYFPSANAQVAAIPMIETAEAVANLDDILSVPGINAIYVGPADLSLTLGLPPGLDNDDPAFTDAIATIVAGCERHGVIPGIHCSPELAGKRAEQGFRMLSVGYDFGPVMAALRADLSTARAATTPA